MGTPGFGFQSYIQFGRESTWGTAVAATKRLGFLNENVQPNIGFIKDNTLNNATVRANIYPVGEYAIGTIDMVLDYEGLLMLFDGVYGTATFGNNGGADAGVGPYTHTFTEKALLNSYTIEIIKGNISATKCDRLIGAKIVGFNIKAAAGQSNQGLCTVTWDIVAKQKQIDQTPTAALTAITRVPSFFYQAAVVDNTADAVGLQKVRSFDLIVKRAVDDKRFYMGSTTIDEPVVNDYSMGTLKFQRELQSTTLKTAFSAGTAANPTLTLTSGAKVIAFTIGAGVLTQYTDAVTGYGIVLQDATIEAVSNAGVGVGLVITNTQATITT